jgi:hypothetical protein
MDQTTLKYEQLFQWYNQSMISEKKLPDSTLSLSSSIKILKKSCV